METGIFLPLVFIVGQYLIYDEIVYFLIEESCQRHACGRGRHAGSGYAEAPALTKPTLLK